jgi:pimeloyl-ACP methyl ester carboxylesterase
LLLKAQQIDHDHVMKPTSFSVIAPQTLLGIPYYDSLKINIPVLLIHAEWDSDTPAYMSQALFGKLVNAPLKRYVVIGEGTHSVIMEKNRMQLFREVQLFLDEPR